MKELIAYVGIENLCQVWIQNESPETEPHTHAILEKVKVYDTFSSLWKHLTEEEKSYAKTLLLEEQKWASENDEADHLYVYTRTLDVIDEIENHYYKLFIKEDGFDGRWNVIQVKGDLFSGEARYFVLKGDIDNPEPMPFLSHGWITQDEQGFWFTDGEDYTLLEEWVKVAGTLIQY